MRNNCYIDGISTWEKFGVRVTKGGYSDLLAFPALVEPDKNDWPEEDGIEVDLSDPKIQPKEITISFLASNPSIDVSDFIVFISKPGYHTLRVPVLNREWRLRLLSETLHKVYHNACEFSLKFVEDMPVRPAVTLPDPGLSVYDSGYKLDNVSFANYGIMVDVAKDDLMKSPQVKKALNRKISTVDGQIYDADHLVFSSKDVSFKCHFKAATIEKFWQCYDAFFGDLIQPEERELYVGYEERSFPCYYKKSSGFKILSLRPTVIVQLTLTLVFTMFRINETHYILVTENSKRIITENGFYINMKYYGS